MSDPKGDRSTMPSTQVRHEQATRKLSRHDAARRLAQIVEESMTRKGLSEDKKDARVKSAIEYVDAVIEKSAK
jgi:hypothetical protein